VGAAYSVRASGFAFCPETALAIGARVLLLFFVAAMLIAISGQHAPCQTSSVQPSATSSIAAASPQQMPAYEVATIKAPGVNEFAPPLRVYIQSAFGIPLNSVGWVIGPEWINSTKYVIRGKAPDSVQRAMQTMSVDERRKQVQLMEQSLLADRFKLKAHFETREMPVYQLIVAKDGAKLREDTDASHGQMAVGASAMRGRAVTVRNFIDGLESVPDIGGRVVIDKTELSGNYDFSLKWTPLGATAPSEGASVTASAPDAEGESLFTAIEEQLGLKLVPARGPGQVLVIDHIERPTEN
jgi:bla regulator protein blaR1